MGLRFYDKDANLIGDCGIAEARKNHYYPSVTTILDVINKHAINRWREDLLIEEAFNISPIFADHEREEAKKCVIDRVAAKADAAPRLGTQWHEDIARWLAADDLVRSETTIPETTLESIHKFLNENDIVVLGTEKKFCNGLWAGTIDVVGDYYQNGHQIIIDWKTQSTKNGKVRFYDTWAMQLAAYATGIESNSPDLISVVLSTTEPPLIKAKTWGNNGIWIDAFYSAYNLWKVTHNYDPQSGERVFKDE